MKKILLATSALVLSAGMASAQGLSIGGDARMGVQWNDAGWGGGLGNWRMESRVNLNFAATVQGDHGLSFGMFSRVRTDNAWQRRAVGDIDFPGEDFDDTLTTSGDFSGHNVWVEASGLRLTFGNTSGPIEAFGVAGAVPMGYTGGTFQQFGGLYTANAGAYLFDSFGPGTAQLASATYSMGDYRVGIARARGGHTEVAGQASFDAFTIAAGWANNAARYRTVSAAYNAGDWGASAIWARTFGNDYFTLGGRVDVGGGTASAYIGQHNSNNVGGISYRYGLGGGATLGANLERVQTGANRAELGVIFSF